MNTAQPSRPMIATTRRPILALPVFLQQPIGRKPAHRIADDAGP